MADKDGLEKDIEKSWEHISQKWWPAVKKSWKRIWDEKFKLKVRHAIADVPVEARRATPYGSARIAWMVWLLHILIIYPRAWEGFKLWIN